LPRSLAVNVAVKKSGAINKASAMPAWQCVLNLKGKVMTTTEKQNAKKRAKAKADYDSFLKKVGSEMLLSCSDLRRAKDDLHLRILGLGNLSQLLGKYGGEFGQDCLDRAIDNELVMVSKIIETLLDVRFELKRRQYDIEQFKREENQ